MDEQRFEPLCCHHFAGLYAGALFESVFFKKDTVFQTKKIHKIMGTVLLVLITIRVAPFLFSQNSKRGPFDAGYQCTRQLSIVVCFPNYTRLQSVPEYDILRKMERSSIFLSEK